MKTLKLNNPDMAIYVKSMGKLFRVTAVCKTDAEANAIIASDNAQAVIAEDCNGLIYLAEKYGAVCPSFLIDNEKDKHTKNGPRVVRGDRAQGREGSRRTQGPEQRTSPQSG